MAGRKKSTSAESAAKKTVKKAETVQEAPVVKEEQETPAVNVVVEQKTAPVVKIAYIDSVIPNNQIPIGKGRFITGSGRIFTVPMEEFEGEFLTPFVMKLIDKRKFIVLDGLTEEQRYQYNCHYAEGEIVRNEGVFDALFDMETEKAVAIFSALCDEHKRLVATRFMTAYFERHDNRITRSKIEALNKASKITDPDGLFTPIVKDFNEKNV